MTVTKKIDVRMLIAARIWTMLFVLASAASLVVAPLTLRAEETSGEQRNWALLIGSGTLSEQTKADFDDIPFTKNDVDELYDTLINRGNYMKYRVKALRDPSCKKMREGINEFFNNPGFMPNDLVLLYFTGHGYEENKKLYLVPTDFNINKVAETGIDIAELHDQLLNCPVKDKIIIIDSCHAGIKNKGTQGAVPASRIVRAFKDLKGVVTLASSQEGESSYPTTDNLHSLYTYWLIAALKGHADKGMIGQVTIDDVHTFVEKMVHVTAKKRYGVSQSPVREIGLAVPGTPAVLTRLKAIGYEDLLAEMAAQIAEAVPLAECQTIAVFPDFTVETVGRAGPQQTAAGLPLSTVLADKLHKDLRQQRNVHPIVVDDYASFKNDVEGLLATKAKSSAWAIAQKAAPKASVVTTPDKFVMVQGRLRHNGSIVLLHADAYRVSDEKGIIEPIAQAGGRARCTPVANGTDAVNENPIAQNTARQDPNTQKPDAQIHAAQDQFAANEFPLTAKSVAVVPSDFTTPMKDSVTYEELPQSAAAAEQWDMPDRLEHHPMEDPKYPFRVDIMVGDKRKPVKYIDNDAYVALDTGETYRIRLEHIKAGGKRVVKNDHVLVKLLVDGLSIFDQPMPGNFKAQFAAPPGGVKPLPKSVRWEVAEKAVPTTLAEASARPLPPNVRTGYHGFYIGRDGWYCEFNVVDAADSLAKERGFTDSIGIITAVFYEDGGLPLGDVGTNLGPLVQGEKLGRIPVGKPKNELGFLSIHYVSSSAWEKLPGRGQ